MRGKNGAREETPRVLVSARYPILFGENDTSLVMINKGVYTFVDDPFKDERNLIPPPSRRRVNIEVINFWESVTESDVFSFLADLGKRPAFPEHCFVLAYQYPSLFSELFERLEQHCGATVAKPISPYDDDRIDLMEQIMTEGELVVLAIGKAVSTCVIDLNVFPALTYKDSFGAGMNLVGYHTMTNRTYSPNCFFLAIPVDD